MADLSISFLGDASSVVGAAGQTEAALGRVEGSATKAGRGIQAALGTAAVAGIAALGAGLVGAVTAAAGFEKQMSAVGAVAGATASELQALTAMALQLGKDTSFSAKEAAVGIEELVKAGVSVADILGGAGRAALDLAAAGAISVGEAAEIASNAMNVFGIKGSEMAHVADQIAGAANASAISVNDYKFSLAAAGAVAATVGIGFEDLTTAIAVMGQAGIKGSDAGTSLKTMLLNLSPSTKAAKAEMQALGIITADGANQFFTAEGKAKSLAEISGVLKTATANLTKEQKINALQTIFGTDAIRAAAIMAEVGAEGFEDMAAAIGKVTAQKVAEERLNNLVGSIEKLKGSLETGAIILGGLFTPALKELADMLTDEVNAGIEILEQLPDAIGTVQQVLAGDWAPDDSINAFVLAVGNTAVMLRDTFGPAVVVVGAFITDILVPAFRAIAAPLAAGTAAFLGVIAASGVLDAAIGAVSATLAFMLTPLGLVALAAGALAAAWTVNFGDIQGKTAAAWVAIQPTLAALYDWLSIQIPAALTWLATVAWPAMVAAGQVAASWITGTAIPAIKDLAAWLQPKIEDAFTWLTEEALPAIGKAVQDAAKWITGTAIPALTEFAQWLQPKIEAAWSWLTATAIPAIGAALEGVATWLNEMAIPALAEFAAWLQPNLEAAWSWLTGTAFPAIASTGEKVVATVQKIGEFFTALNTELAKQGVYADLERAWPILVEIGTKFVNDVLAPMGPGFKTTAENAAGFAAAIKDVTGYIAPFLEGAQKIADVLTKIQRAAIDSGLAIRGFLQSIGVPMPNNPIPGIIPSAPGSQTPPPAEAPSVGPVYGPELPPENPPQSSAPPPAVAAPTARAPIDNSSRASFVRTAWPYMLEAAGGNRDLAEMMLGAAISENGDVGKGGSFIGNNFFGIKAQPGEPSFTAATWEQENGQRVNQDANFRAYETPVQGFAGFMEFLKKNPRYAPALAAYEQSGDAQGLFDAINAPPANYATDPNWAATVGNIRRNQVAPITASLPGGNVASAVGAATAPPSMPAFNGTTAAIGNQFEMGLPRDQAIAACGPAAVALFMQATGRTPNVKEVMEISAKNGWTAAAGMGGVGAFQQTLSDLGVESALLPFTQDTAGAVAAGSVQAGNLTAISTGMHYNVAQGFDPATGKFDLGETGDVIPGGSRYMTIDEITALQGPVNGIIQLLGQAKVAIDETGVSMQTMGASAAVDLTPQLAGIGQQIDPLVAQFDQGALSASGLTDAIILSAANQGIATESTAAYAQGMIGQDEAMRAVLTSFAATTPAAAELLTQLDSGAISTEQAAIAFAGLSTSTAIATGALSTMSTDGGAAIETLAATGVDQMTLMAAGSITAADLMNTGVVSAATLMGAGVITQADLMEDGTLTAAGLMKAGAVTAAELMNAGVVTEAQLMQADAVLAAEVMHADAVAEIDLLKSEGTESLAGLHVDGVAEMDAMNTESVAAAQTMHTDAGTAIADLATDADESFGAVAESAGAAVTGMEAVGEVEIEAPDVSDVIDAMKDVEKAAEKAADAIKDINSATKGGSKGGGSGKGNPLGKAAGGPVSQGIGYIVGENGPELFVPLSDGTIIPNNQMRSMSGVNPHSPIGTTSDGISGSWGEYIVEDITRLTNDRADAVIESLTQVHESVQDVALGVTNGLDDVVSTISSAAGAVKSLLERIVTEVAKLPNLLTQINTSIGRIGTGTGTTPRPTPTPTPSPAPVIRPPQPGDPKRGINPPGGTRPTGPREGEPSPPRGVTPTPGVRPPRVPAPTDPTRGVTPNPNPGTRSSRSDNPFGEVIASATQMFREVATSTNNMRYVAGANVESMSQNVTTSADEMGNNVGSIFTGLETDTFDDFIQAAAAVDEAIRVMAENAGINVANMGTDISDVFWALGDDMAAALEAAELVAVPAADVLANAVVAKLGTMRAGTVQQINLLGSDMAVEFDRIAAASNGPSKNAYDLGEKITFSLGEAISDSSETNVVEPLVEAVLEAIDEAIDKAERKAGRSSRSAAFVLSGGGRSDGPGMAELIAEVQALKRSITQARSVSVNYTDSGPPASLMQDVAVLESLSRSGT